MRIAVSLLVRLAAAHSLGLALAGCGAAIPDLPSQGGPAWIELTSEHFTLWTDASENRGAQLIRGMEDLRQAEIGAAFRGASANGRSLVIALRDAYEVHAFLPEQFVAYARIASGALSQPLILLDAEDDVTTGIPAHELTHIISHAVLRYQPHWFAEGLAKYFETIAIDHAAGTVTVGRAPKGMVHELTPLRTVLECETLPCMDAGFYASAWAFYTFLSNAHPDKLVALELALQKSRGATPPAWQEVFGPGDSGTADVQLEMRDWIAHGRHTELHFTARFHDWPTNKRTFSDADVHAARALLYLTFGHRSDAAAEARFALDTDPVNVMASSVSDAIGSTPSAAKAIETVKVHPDDWRAWFLLAKVSAADRPAASARACALLAANPQILPPLPCGELAAPADAPPTPSPSPAAPTPSANSAP